MITFSDGSSIMLHNGLNGQNGKDGNDGLNGGDGVTPMIKIDNEGYWCVSYDGGATYERITDKDGAPICSVGARGADGEDGIDGKDGICVRVVIDSDGYYVFETYVPTDPQTIIDSITTYYTSNPASILQSIVQDDNTGVITLTLADGQILKFNLDVTYPTGIVVLTDKVVLTPNGKAKFEFRINPSNSRFIPVVTGDEVNVELDVVDTRASYVTAPSNYHLVAVEHSKDADGEVKAGQYTATVEDLGRTAKYDENVVVVLTTKDGSGERIQLSSSLVEFCSALEPQLFSIKIDGIKAVEVSNDVFQIKMPYGADVTALKSEFETNGARMELKYEQNGSNDASTIDLSTPVTLVAVSTEGLTKEYRVAVNYSDLPVVYITTPSPITSKSTWTENCTIDIWNAGEQSVTYEAVQIKGRGNTTWAYYMKKPYAIKLDSKAEVLGMKKHKRWALLANYLDVTCLRNASAFEIARQLDGLAWTPSGHFVDVVMNGQLVGNYYLCEQIKVDKNRVNIAEIDPSDTDDESVTGGYIFELDTYYDELYKFRTQYRNLPVQFKDPDDDIADAQFNYVKNYFNTVEEILYGGDADTDEVFDYIDLDSYVDWYIVHTLSHNGEPNHPKSSYMHKDRNEKLVAGPVWDFDFGTFRLATATDGLTIKTSIWYNALFKNATFVARLKERWAANKAKLAQVENFIAETAEQIRESAEGNKIMWPVSGSPNYDGELSFTEAVEQMKQAYRQRIESVDRAIEAL